MIPKYPIIDMEEYGKRKELSLESSLSISCLESKD
jgi:hypothetical protein